MEQRVLYVITKATWGGAQRYVFDLLEGARERNLQVALAYGERGILAERAEALGIPCYQVRGLARDLSLASDLLAVGALYRLFRSVRPSVVHLNSSKAGFSGSVAARLAGVPRIIFTAHGWAFTEPRNALSKALFVGIQYATALFSDTVIAVSEAIASHTRRWLLPKKRVVVIRHGIAPFPLLPRDEARAALIELSPSLRENRDGLWVGTIAELHKNKGIDVGIRAWKRLPEDLRNTPWVVLGGGEEHERLTKMTGESSPVHLLGFQKDAGKYLKAFDLFLLPSRTEALGYVLLEAGHAGVPCIAAEVGGIPEVLGFGAGALFRAGDPEDLVRYLTPLLRDGGQRTQIAATLSEKTRTSFSLARMREATYELYGS